MAMRTSCCFNLVPPNPPRSSPSKTSKLICRNKDESSRPCTSPCVIGMACLIIGTEMGTSLANTQQTQNAIIAKEVANSEMVLLVDHEDHSAIDSTSSSDNKVVKWSDKRTCPPWRLNSLETIVPENLPRPSARRKWEAVGYSYSNKDAPPVKLVVRRTPSCFSM
ncbi:hypothetical protein FNV43_RR12371 [Rhamnella rubrinervis]|uniref:Uncharacterized protein n=1 Tax=Rhamnella rubrinervis TaxID=2594499 RepID=A0A8K0H7I1_9ROSA|nr:hypothetical protein FNV43_RR12371 [Rhamnella rubrinervis]